MIVMVVIEKFERSPIINLIDFDGIGITIGENMAHNQQLKLFRSL